MDTDLLAARFESDRPHLHAVAYRMLGSLTEAEDAVQETWFRLSRSGGDEIQNLTGWLTTVVGRVCLDMLRARVSRREQLLDTRLPDPIVTRDTGAAPDPEHEALLADSVGLALLVVLETLAPAERLAFVLHDMFGMPFDGIAPVVDRTPAATRQLASRARRRVRGIATPDPDPRLQREVVDAFLAAARDGDFDALVALLDPDVVLHTDAGTPGRPTLVRGAETVARGAVTFARLAASVTPALVNGAAGIIAARDGRPYSVVGFTIVDGRIVEMDIFTDPGRLARLDLQPSGA